MLSMLDWLSLLLHGLLLFLPLHFSFHWGQCQFRGSSSVTPKHVCFVLACSPNSGRWSHKHHYPQHYYPLVCPHCNLRATFHILQLLVNGNSNRSHRTPNHSRGAQEFWRAQRRIIISCNGNNIRDLMGNKPPRSRFTQSALLFISLHQGRKRLIMSLIDMEDKGRLEFAQ